MSSLGELAKIDALLKDVSIKRDSTGAILPDSQEPQPQTSTPTNSVTPEKTSDLALVVPLTSKHFNTSGSKYNEFNYGIGISKDISENLRAFVMGYKNSYDDPTLAAGVTYAPIKKQFDNFKTELGVTGGVAYTHHGSYARQMEKISKGYFNLMGGIAASIEHIPTGIAVDTITIPPVTSSTAGAIGINLRKRF